MTRTGEREREANEKEQKSMSAANGLWCLVLIFFLLLALLVFFTWLIFSPFDPIISIVEFSFHQGAPPTGDQSENIAAVFIYVGGERNGCDATGKKEKEGLVKKVKKQIWLWWRERNGVKLTLQRGRRRLRRRF